MAVVNSGEAPKARNWAAGLEYAVNSWGSSRSVLAQRDLGPFRLGARLGYSTRTSPAGGVLHGGEAAIILSVVVPRDGFSVSLCGGAPASATQQDVIGAILAEAIPRDKENPGRLEVASAVVKPGAEKSRT